MCSSFVMSLLLLLGSGEVRDGSFPKIPRCLVLQWGSSGAVPLGSKPCVLGVINPRGRWIPLLSRAVCDSGTRSRQTEGITDQADWSIPTRQAPHGQQHRELLHTPCVLIQRYCEVFSSACISILNFGILR